MKNNDILDLCRLSRLEEAAQDYSAEDKESALKAIEWRKKHLVTRLINDPSPLGPRAQAQTEIMPCGHTKANLIRVSEQEEKRCGVCYPIGYYDEECVYDNEKTGGQ